MFSNYPHHVPMGRDRHSNGDGPTYDAYASLDPDLREQGSLAQPVWVAPNDTYFNPSTLPDTLDESALQPGSSTSRARGSCMPSAEAESAEDTETEKGKGKASCKRTCKHRKLAIQWRDRAMETTTQLNNALYALATIGNGMNTLTSEVDATKQGVHRINTQLSRDCPALLAGQGRMEQYLQPQSSNYRAQRQAANRSLRDDLQFLAESMASGETASALQKVHDMLSYMDTCANIQGSSHIWGEESSARAPGASQWTLQ